MSLEKNDGISLLTLARHDLTNQPQSSSTQHSTTNHRDDDHGPLVLMQLPSSLSLGDLRNSRIVGPPQSSRQSAGCSLVLEHKGLSFDLSRVETSNALVLVPPSAERTTARPHNQDDDENLTSVPTCKKPRLRPVAAQLVQPGGSGASFLELRPRVVSVDELCALLQPHVLDPYQTTQQQDNEDNGQASSWQGRSVASLAMELQVSHAQVLQVLPQVPALALKKKPCKNDTNDTSCHYYYGLLSEEALQEATLTIVATLLECDELGDDYASRPGILLDRCVQESVLRVPDRERYEYLEQVLRHVVLRLAVEDEEPVTDFDGNVTVRLDFGKIAGCVARRLLQKQTSPVPQSVFVEQWQSETPGVGPSYQVSMSLLSDLGLDDSVMLQAAVSEAVVTADPGSV